MTIEVDVRGLSCPIPVIKVKEVLEKDPGEEVAVLIDSATTRENVTRLAEQKGFSVSMEETGGEFRLTITK